MKLAFCVLSLLVMSSQSFAWNEVIHRFSIEGKAAQDLYAAIADDPQADLKGYDTVELGEGVKCQSGKNSCVTFSHDGDEKRLERSEQVFAALKAGGANLDLYIQGVECSKQGTKQNPTFICRIEELVSKN